MSQILNLSITGIFVINHGSELYRESKNAAIMIWQLLIG